MKTAETKSTHSQQHNSTNTQQPFFNKEQEGAFFSEQSSEYKPFFPGADTSSFIQPKYASGDKPFFQPATVPLIQAKCAACEAEEGEQQKEQSAAERLDVQRMPAFESEDNPVQAKIAPRKTATTPQIQLADTKEQEPEEEAITDLPGNVTSLPLSSPEEETAGSGRALPPTVRARMETAFHHDFGHVRIHTGEGAAKAAADQNAHAFTNGRDISFGANEFAPYTTRGDRLLAHELTHVVQQDEGRMPARGVLSPNHELEREAYATERRLRRRFKTRPRGSKGRTGVADGVLGLCTNARYAGGCRCLYRLDTLRALTGQPFFPSYGIAQSRCWL